MTALYRATTRPPDLPARTPRPWTQLRAGESRSRAVRFQVRRRSPVRSTAPIHVAGCTFIHVGSCRQLSSRGEIGGVNTRVLAEQAAAVDPSRLGKSVGFLGFDEMRRVDAALRIVFDL